MGLDSPPETLGRFRLEREIARTPVSVTYLASVLPEGQVKVALKVMREGDAPGLTPDGMRLIANEAEVCKVLDHGNLVRILQAGREGPYLFVAMAPVSGLSLQAYLDREGPLVPRTAAEVGLEVAKALAFGHGRGLFHKNLKTSNVFILRGGKVSVADFGLARFPDPLEKGARGTEYSHSPAFLPPEQALGDFDRVDQRGDVYALGVLVYRMVTGKPPFECDRGERTHFQILNVRPTRPRRHRRGIPRSLEAVILKAMEKRPLDRYASMPEMAMDLKKVLTGETPHALEERGARRALGRVFTSRAGMVAVFFVALGITVAGAMALRGVASSGAVAPDSGGGSKGDRKGTNRTADRAQAHRRRARALVEEAVAVPLKRETLDKRLALLSEAVKLDPASGMAHLHLGYALLLDGRMQLSQPSLARGEHICANAFSRYLWGIVYHEYLMDPGAAGEKFRAGVDSPPYRHYGLLCRAWHRWLSAGKDRDVLELLNQAESERAYPWETELLRGIVLQAGRETNLGRARLAYSRATEALGGFPPALVRRATAFLQENRAQAVRDIESALAVDPSSAHGRFYLGFIRLTEGRSSEAVADFHIATQVAPRYWDARFYLGDCYLQLGRFPEAVDALSRAIELKPDYAPAYQKRAYARYMLKRYLPAEEDYRAAVDRAPFSAEMRYHLGTFLQAMGRLREAEEAFDEAIRLAPQSATYYVARADLRFHQDRFLEALQDYEQAIAYDARLQAPYYRAAFILIFKMPDPEVAREYVRAGLKCTPGPYHENLKELEKYLDR